MRFAATLALLLAATIIAADAAGKPAKLRAGMDISSFLTSVNDLSAQVHVTQCDLAELEKVGADFSRPYELKNFRFDYKRPGKMRLEGKSPLFGIAMLIYNGPMRYYSVARLKLRKTEDLDSTPTRKQSLLEYAGLLPAEALHFLRATYVRQDTDLGRTEDVFDLSFLKVAAGPRYRIWIDPRTRVTVKREWYDKQNDLRATFFYKDAREVTPGVWIASRIEVQNPSGVTALVVELKDVVANSGLSDSLFAVKQG